MKIRKCSRTVLHHFVATFFACSIASAQTTVGSQTTPYFNRGDSVYSADGARFHFVNEQDGFEVLKTDADETATLARAQNGARGDRLTGICLDPQGGIYVVGTSISHTLLGSPGAAYPAASDSSTNSFLAKYDAGLHLIYLTFLGAGDTSATGVAATRDAVFVTGSTRSRAFPTTPAAWQRAPSTGSTESGFAQRFSSDGSAFVYSTYLSGPEGSTAPTAIVADSFDNAFVAGSTSSSNYPTISALQAAMLPANGVKMSGFLSRIDASGSALIFSTYIAGSGVTHLALDPLNASILLTGQVWLGGFPVPGLRVPFPSSSSNVLLRIPTDGRSVSPLMVLKQGAEQDIDVASDGTRRILQKPATLSTTDLLRIPSSNSSSANPALSVSTNSVTFPTPVAVTQIASDLQIVTVANTGTSSFPLTFSINGDFTLVDGCPAVLIGGASCVLEIGFAPSLPGERSGVLSVAAGSGFTPTYISLTGTSLDILPSNSGTLDLGQTLIGEPTVTWYKMQQPLVSVTAATNSTLFGVALVADTGSGHGSLPAASFAQSTTANCNNCWLGVQFYTQSAGTENASLMLSSNVGGSPYTLLLAADALPETGPVLSPATQDFGSIAAGSSSVPTTFMLTNLLANSAPLTIQSVSVSGDFALVTNASGGADCAGTIAATASCFSQVSFAPSTTGEREGMLTMVTTGGTATARLAGTGTPGTGVAVNPTSLSFTNTPGPTATEQTVTLTNTGTSPVIAGTPTVSDPSFQVNSGCAALQPGASCSIAVLFRPKNVTVAATLSIPVTADGRMTDYAVGLIGSYTLQNAGLQIVSDEVNFGSAATSALGSTRLFTLNNLTSKALSIAFTLPRQFPMTSSQTCTTVSANGSCSFSISFLPVDGGSLTGTVMAEGTPMDGSEDVQALAYLLGYGSASGSLIVSGNAIPNTPINFGQVISGQTAQRVLTLTNNGSRGLTIHRITSEPPFVTTSTCGAAMLPNDNCTVTVTYEPVDEVVAGSGAVPRSDTGTLTIESDSVTSPNSVGMSGIAEPVVSSNPASSAVLRAFQLSQGSLTFPNTQIGNASAKQTVTLTNTGTTSLHVLSTFVSTDFTSSTTCTTLVPGDACSFTVQFTPTTATTSSVRSGTVSILSDAGTSLEFISLLGTSTPAALTLSPTALDFGTVSVSANDALSLTITDTAATPVTFLGVSASGDYTVELGSCPSVGTTLAAGASCVLTVTFAPHATGKRTGTLSVANDASQLPLTAALSGTGAEAQLTVTPGALAYGNVDVGSPAVLTLTLLNNGSASLSGVSNLISGSNASDFAVTSPCTVTTLAPNQGCSETVTFTPSATGARVAALTVASSDPNGPATIALTGTGVSAGSFVLSVNGGSAASVTVASGSPGSYSLLLTPKNSFAGTVALTCAPITAGEYTSCSLLASTLTLGSSALSSTATINTITTDAAMTIAAIAALLILPVTGLRRPRRRFVMTVTVAVGLVVCLNSVGGCGGGGGAVSTSVKTTPAGTYQYRVTASSTSGAAVSSSVTLTLVVQ